MIRIENFHCEGLLPILEAFPSYDSAIKFVTAFRPSFLKSPQKIALQNHFTEHTIEYTEFGKMEKWLLDGKRHRNDGPAYIDYYKNGNISSKQWYQNGEFYRNDGPVSIGYYEDGKIQYQVWYENGHRHRIDGPALISYSEDGWYEEWYQNGHLHREDGPAWINYYDNGNIRTAVWYKNGKLLRNKIFPRKDKKMIFDSKI